MGIGEALRRSAASLAAAGNTIEESIGLIVAANSVIQDPDVVGTALKTSSMYLRAAKTEAEEAGVETDGMAQSVSKLRAELEALTGVDIMIDANTFEGQFEVYRQIADVWDTLTDTTKANVTALLGGKRNANIITSLIENFDDAEAAMRTAQNAMGSAEKENEKYLESIEGHFNSLTVAYEKLSSDVMGSDLIKGGVDFLTTIVNLLDKVQNATNIFGNDLGHKLGILTPIVKQFVSSFLVSHGLGFGTVIDENGIKRFTAFGRTIDQYKQLTALNSDQIKTALNPSGLRHTIPAAVANSFSTSFKNLFGIFTKKDAEDQVKLMEQYRLGLTQTSDLEKYEREAFGVGGTYYGASQYFRETATEVRKLGANSAEAKAKVNNFGQTLTNAAGRSNGFLKTLGAFGAQIGWMLLLQAAVVGIEWIVEGLISWAQADKKAREEAQKHAEVIKEELTEIEELKSAYDSAKEAYENNKGSKEALETATENLTSKLGLERDELDKNIDKYKEYSDAIDRAYAKKIQESLGTGENEGLAGGVSADLKDLKDLSSMESGSLIYRRTQIPIFDGASTMREFASFVNNLGLPHFFVRGDGGSLTYYNQALIGLKQATSSQEIAQYLPAIKEQIDEYKTLAEEMIKQYGVDVLTDTESGDLHEAYSALTKQTDELETAYNKASDSLRYYNDRMVESSVILSDNIASLSLPKTYEDYLEYRDKVINEVEADSEKFRISPKQTVEEAISDYLLSDDDVSAFEQRYKDLIGIATRIPDSVQITTEELGKKLKDLPNEIISELNSGLINFENGIDAAILEAQKNVYGRVGKAASESNEEFAEAIKEVDKVQGKLASAYQTLVKGQTLSKDTINDLISEYPVLADQIDGLTAKGIEEYFNKIKQEQSSSLDERIREANEYLDIIATQETAEYTTPEEKQEWKELEKAWRERAEIYEAQRKYLNSLSLAAGNTEDVATTEWMDSINNNITVISEIKDLLKSENFEPDADEWKTSIDKIFDTMIEAAGEGADELKEAIIKARNGYSEEDIKNVLKLFEDFYETDKKNFNAYLDEKSERNTWDKVKEDAKEYFDKLQEQYGVDLAKCKTYVEARNALLSMKTDKLNKYDGLNADSLRQEKFLGDPEDILGEIPEWQKIADAYKDIFSSVPDDYNGHKVDTGNDSSKDVKDEKDLFEDYMREYEKLHERELISDEAYYNALEYANNTFLKNTLKYESDFISNETKIFNGRKDMILEAHEKALEGLSDSYDSTLSTEAYIKQLENYRDEWYGLNSAFRSTYGAKAANEQIKELNKTIKGLRDDLYKEKLEKIQKSRDNYIISGGDIIESERQFITEWIKLNDELYKATDPKKYKENLEEIVGYFNDAIESIDEYMDRWGRINGYNESNPESREAYQRERDTKQSELLSSASEIAKGYTDASKAEAEALKAYNEFNKNLGLTDEDIQALEAGGWTDSLERISSGGKGWLNEWQKLRNDLNIASTQRAEFLDALKAMDAAELENAEYDAETLRMRLENRSITWEDYEQGVKGLNDIYRSHIDDTPLLDGTFFEQHIGASKEYEYKAEEAAKQNNGTLKSGIDYINSLMDLTGLFKDANGNITDLAAYTDSWEKTIQAARDVMDEAIARGEADPESARRFVEFYIGLAYQTGADLSQSFLSGIRDTEDDIYEYLSEQAAKHNNRTVEGNSQYIDDLINANQVYKNPDGSFKNRKAFEDNWADIAGEAIDIYKDELSKGLIDPDGYNSLIDNLFDRAEKDGIKLSDSLRAEAEDVLDETYSYSKNLLEKRTPTLLSADDMAAQTKLFNDLLILASDTYEGVDFTKFNENASNAIDTYVETLKTAFSKGYIDEQYLRSELSRISRWAEEHHIVLPVDFETSSDKELLEIKKEQTVNYLTDWKDVIDARYNEEINKLKEQEEELEEINDLEEKRVALIKARNDLEDARKNKNQLIFKDGTYYYDYDQEDLLDKQEKVDEAEEALRKQQVEKEISDLEKERDKIDDALDAAIAAVNAYGEERVSRMDALILADALKDYADDGKLTQTNLDNLTDLLGDSSKALEAIKNGTFDMDLDSLAGLIKTISENGGLQSASEDSIASAAAAAAVENTYYQDSVSNDNSVNVGAITITVQGGTSEEMLMQFADQLSSSIQSLSTKVMYD